MEADGYVIREDIRMGKKVFVCIATLLILTTGLLVVGCGNKAGQENKKASTTMEVPQLDSGPISGILDDSIWTYKGIPYAAPPVGELRWKEPQPVDPWQDVKTCTAFGPACPQSRPALAVLGTELNNVGPQSEDCLYLNVWTPAASPNTNLPVMVWIHGGGFDAGAASQFMYDGRNLAEKGVVLVSINYRLGAFGFMAHPQLSDESSRGVSGNYGLMDQIASLEWVQRNIDVFGGDPGKVTVFGESAGGGSVCDLMASPLTGGLFQRAIVESGGFLSMGLPANPGGGTLSSAEKTGEKMAEALGCDGADDVLACMRGKTAEEVTAAQDKQGGVLEAQTWFPIIDGWVLTDKPQNIFAAGEQQKVPLLIGTNANEATVLASNITADQYGMLIAYLYGSKADRVSALYPVVAGDAKAAFVKLLTELGFAAPSKFAAAGMANVDEPAYLYKFTMTSNDPRVAQYGSFHSLEIAYVFGNMDKAPGVVVRPEDKALSEAMMNYWTSFASSGDPNGKGEPQWPALTIESDQYQELGAAVSTQTGYYPQAYDLLKTITGM
jgi:para-nitrobenzyl esterase